MIKLKYWMLRALPNFMWPIKYLIVKHSLKSVGRHFRFGQDSVFNDAKLISIGDNVFMGIRTVINTTVDVSIGNNVMFGPEVMIMGGDHNISKVGLPMRTVKTGGVNLPIVIEDDVWVGSRALILKGVTVREGAVIGAGSIVTRDILPYSINVGYPSRTIRCRFTRKDLMEHLSLVKSKYKFEEIFELYNLKGLEIK